MNKAVILYHDYVDTIFSELTDEEVGKLVRAIMVFDSSGEYTEFDDRTVRLAYKRMMNDCQMNREKYERTCERNRTNANKRWHGNTESMPIDTPACEDMPTHTKNADKDKEKDKDKDKNKDKEKGTGKDTPIFMDEHGILYTEAEADRNIARHIALMKINGAIT